MRSASVKGIVAGPLLILLLVVCAATTIAAGGTSAYLLLPKFSCEVLLLFSRLATTTLHTSYEHYTAGPTTTSITMIIYCCSCYDYHPLDLPRWQTRPYERQVGCSERQKGVAQNLTFRV